MRLWRWPWRRAVGSSCRGQLGILLRGRLERDLGNLLGVRVGLERAPLQVLHRFEQLGGGDRGGGRVADGVGDLANKLMPNVASDEDARLGCLHFVVGQDEPQLVLLDWVAEDVARRSKTNVDEHP